MDVHVRDLRYFVAVAEELNFTRAAGRLHLSQPALSKQIRALERTMRTRLFDRDRREVQLTAAGKELLARAQPLLSSWEETVASVSDVAARDAKVLRVGTLTSIGRSLYPGVVDGFAVAQPGWRVELRSFAWGDPTAGLHEHATDVAFLWLPVDAPEVSSKVLASEPLVLEMNTRHRLAGRASLRFADFADEPILALPASAGPLRDFWIAADRRQGRPATIAGEVTSADETFEMVASGVAVHLVAEGNAAIYARPGVTSVPVEDLGPAEFAVAWRRNDRRKLVQTFVHVCVEVAGRAEPV